MTQASPSSFRPMSDESAAWTATELTGNPHQAPDKAARVQRMFTAIARQYDLNNRVHSLGRDQSWRRRAVRLCRVQPGDDVLDVACGTGDLTELFCTARPRSVVGLDFTSAMLDVARDKSRRRMRVRTPSPTYVQGDAMNLPFADRSFDIVSIAFGIRNVADPRKALAEFRRVLRPGGRLLILEFSHPRNRVLRAVNNLYTRRIMPLTATLIAGDRSGAYRYLPRSVSTFSSGAEFAGLLAACGFARVEPYPMTFGVCTAYLAREN
jgi:demethylmenaquinone methyltransferase/2-methoxy-6-polyprenyl-1,4-benzoquinol methylase